ncbi:Kunitz/Bovine pancreatic trypsin inhibitor domain protein [Dictyocaulus viviparus]|uniref:Papilin n=1 Tax=Dictyocaulus viviparus TaxID=29172 RepID=A0A0D8XQB9_DICVI|nr:Kunitz/Bovine pancreatic trypsin inhibitor domain protein [Dictyocaulus viviparus]
MKTLLISVAVFYGVLDAFSLPFFSSEPDVPYLHPLSPPETNPASARAKRQAYQVYVGGDSSVSLDKTGQSESGPWGPWVPEKCSRTCGGGVQIEKRQCSGECSGPSVRYVSCNLDPCAEGTDFRAEQCAAHNDDVLDGQYYKWLPYKGKNKCELLCKPEGGKFYYKWDEKVVDGTKCDSKVDDICVDGVCLSVGCDGKLGSALKVDKCGICDGDGSKCKTIEGTFDERNLSPGYHDVLRIPSGATSIKIEEARPSSNNLALKNSTNHYFLNGNSKIQVEKDVELNGVYFEYDDAKPERITARGPLKDDITVSVLFRKGNRDAAVKYEFSVPVSEDVDYIYKPGDWSACSVTCGKGVQIRIPYCIDTKTQVRVNDLLCDEVNSTKPEYEKPCETVNCEAEWFEGEWEPCSQTCGDQGEQYRVIYCHQVFANGRRITVDDDNCTAERPPVRKVCNRFSCPEWQAGPWSACSQKCGDAFQYRSVTCRSEKEGEEGKLLPAESCSANSTLESQRPCNLGPCEGLKFYTSEWKLCTKCNDTEETREVTCKDNHGRTYQLEKCLTDNEKEIPPDTRTCSTQQPCIYEWTTSQWSKCSTECGHGHKSRGVLCAIHEQGDITVVDESLCQDEKPESKMNCTNDEKCTGTWYTGPWSPCTAECGGGNQERVAVCLNYDKKPVPEWCDEANMPTLSQECNVKACPTCFDSEFGCCPDNTTFPTGPFNQGCSNCSLSEFGCCADNYTEAIGVNGKGCEEFGGLLSIQEEAAGEEGSGDHDTKSNECTVTNEKGETVTLDCALANRTTMEMQDLFGNETDTNATLHCSKTKFGCCPDWFNPAEGPNNDGCPTFVLGACNETQYGCCHDDVTLARGPNLEGCGEPSCAASLYGCCKDRKTIAFGPHYSGCDRSSFPCELSQYGCCSDGETAALGPNGTGCGEDCLKTKYGCCPDGKGIAKGHHNEGCGCVYAQYGCCPDGKSVARGAGFYGCPETCAQSQFGCCPDGKTPARGAHKEGCPCQYTRYGCCPDGETTALGPRNDGCDDCRYAKYGCCPDGESKAIGPNYAGCPSTTLAPFLLGGTVAPSKISSCALPQNQGSVCSSAYKLVWYYDTSEGRCSQFWYGGCDGNENRFATKEQCETICVEPPGIGRCYLPKVEGPLRCDLPQAKYWYDYNTKQCAAFWWRGCHGNANNFASWEECSTFCKGVGPFAIPTTTTPASPPQYLQQPQQPQQPNEQQDHEVVAHPVDDVTAPRHDERQRPQMPTIEEVCRSTQDSGPCKEYSEKFYYNAYKGTCQTFIYGGCGGNLNRFRTEEECMQRCGFLSASVTSNQAEPTHTTQEALKQISILNFVAHQTDVQQPAIVRPPPPVVPHQPTHVHSGKLLSNGYIKSRHVCHLPLDVGKCQGSFDSWYFEVATGSCVEFKYSGCSGNANRFSSREECEVTCVRQTDTQDTTRSGSSVCDEPKETGPCTNFVTKWYYNKLDGTCNRFHYGGCDGTGNRFDNEHGCKAACANHQDACKLPKVQGPCSGKHEYYYFNSNTGVCEKFVYGGCLGNTNRFATLDECQARCQRK